MYLLLLLGLFGLVRWIRLYPVVVRYVVMLFVLVLRVALRSAVRFEVEKLVDVWLLLIWW